MDARRDWTAFYIEMILLSLTIPALSSSQNKSNNEKCKHYSTFTCTYIKVLGSFFQTFILIMLCPKFG
jgi:hypothetical protein